MMDFGAALLDPLYSVLGVAAEIETESATVTLTAIDRTRDASVQAHGSLRGMELGAIAIETIRPIATVRESELRQKGIALEDLDNSVLTLEGVAWRVTSHAIKPMPSGPGEVVLILMAEEGLGIEA